jgi:hypothetical protein
MDRNTYLAVSHPLNLSGPAVVQAPFILVDLFMYAILHESCASAK